LRAAALIGVGLPLITFLDAFDNAIPANRIAVSVSVPVSVAIPVSVSVSVPVSAGFTRVWLTAA
jgi:hypothetical protein